MTPDEQVAERLLDHAGGSANVRYVDMCFTRLRLDLADPSAVDVAAMEAMPEVAMTFTQSGQFQVVLGARVREVHGALRRLLADDGGRPVGGLPPAPDREEPR